MKRLVFPTLLVTMVLCDPCFAGTKVLLPIFLDQPVHGALGSVWTSQLSMHNSGTSVEGIETCSASLTIPLPACPGVVTPDMELEPGETQHVLPHFSPQPSGAAPGRVITFVPGDIDQIELNLRVADTSRSALNAGTEIPVVRQKDFRTTTLRLLNIPVAPLFRLTFRLYQVSSGSGDYNLRVFDEATSALLGFSVIHIVSPNDGSLQIEPGYLQLGDLSTILPAGTTLPDAIQFEVEPLTSGSTFWAFVSLTNNETQQLTLVTPQ